MTLPVRSLPVVQNWDCHQSGNCCKEYQVAITEEERPGVFTLRVGNLMPGEQAIVRLTLVGLLPYSSGEVTFRFPLVVAPRYVPGKPLPGRRVPGAVRCRRKDRGDQSDRVDRPT